jgi:hypothetical protein
VSTTAFGVLTSFPDDAARDTALPVGPTH